MLDLFKNKKLFTNLLFFSTIFLLFDFIPLKKALFFIIVFFLAIYENHFMKFSIYKISLGLILFFLVFNAYLPNFSSKWNIVDDHKVVEFQLYLREHPQISLKELICDATYGGFDAMCNTIGPRYHPTAQLIIFLKQYFFGVNPLLWYTERFCTIIFSILISFYMFTKFLNPLVSFLITIYLFSEKYFSNFFVSHIPSENYALVSFCIILLMSFYILKNKKNNFKNDLAWFVLTIFSIIGIGTKENFIVLIGPIVIVFLVELYQKRIKFFQIFCLFLVVLFTFYITYVVLKFSSKAGIDVYGNTNNVSSRLNYLISGLNLIQVHLFFLSGICFFSLITIVLNKKIKVINKVFVLFFLIQSFLISNFIFQYIFYNGAIPLENRYDFPGKTSLTLFWIVDYIFIFYILRLKLRNQFFRKNLRILEIVITMVLLFLSSTPFNNLMALSLINKVRTNHFTNGLEQIVNIANENPSLNVSFESLSIYDYEPVVSTKQFFDYYRVKNNFSLRLHDYDKIKIENENQKILKTGLMEWSEKGGYVFKKPLPLNEKNCISVYFTDKNTVGNCEYKIRLQ